MLWLAFRPANNKISLFRIKVFVCHNVTHKLVMVHITMAITSYNIKIVVIVKLIINTKTRLQDNALTRVQVAISLLYTRNRIIVVQPINAKGL